MLTEKLHSGDPAVQALYPEAWPQTDYSGLIQKKQAHYSASHRAALVCSLERQYKNLDGNRVHENIGALAKENTFTVCTGQQLHIFLGPLFVIYKAITVIHECRRLSATYPDQNFVPVFWLAGEDHDMAEINWVEVFGKKYQWETPFKGPAGRAGLEGLSTLCDQIAALFSNDPEAAARMGLFREAYTRHKTLTEATRYLLHSFFAEYGLICLDADDPDLKALFRGQMKADILENRFEIPMVAQARAMKGLGLKTSINPRKTNFFYLENDSRLRIDKVGESYATAVGERSWTTNEIEREIEDHPGNFSPNVAMRPLYQESILPNLAYVGGPGEINYWFQIAGIFEVAGIPRPAIVPRKSAVWLDPQALEQLSKLGFSPEEMWDDMESLERNLLQKLQKETGLEQPIARITAGLDLLYDRLYTYKNIHLKDIKHSASVLTKKLYSVEKELKDALLSTDQGLAAKNRLKKLKEKYFFQASPQERKSFFVENYLKYGKLPEFPESAEVKKIFSVLTRV